LLQELEAERARQLGLTKLRPWDMEVDPSGLGPIKPFKTSAELIEKTQTCFSRLHPDFGRCIEIMKEKGLFDIETRKGQAPGGYNYPLADSGMPFIFMHAAGTFGDMTTMLHEGGHALHTFESDALPIHDLKDTPSEVAELASMGMELLSMAHWDVFFEQDKEALRGAKKDQLYDVLKTLPWMACVDRFHHWLYLNPVHTTDQRHVD